MNDNAFDWLRDDSSPTRRRQKGFGVTELLDLPDSMRAVAIEITRREPVSLSELTEALGRNSVEIELQVNQLVMQGWLDVDENPSGEWVYRVRIAGSPGRILPPGIWQVIDNQWKVPLLRLFPDVVREEFSQCFQLAQYHANEVLFEAGSWQERMYIVASGRVHLQIENEHGETFVVRRVGPGGLFGEMAVLLGGRRPYTALVVEDSQVWSMGKVDLDRLLLRHPTVGLMVRRELSRQLIQPAAGARPQLSPVVVVGQFGLELARCLAEESGDQVVLVDLVGGRPAAGPGLTVVDGQSMHSTVLAQQVRDRAARGEWVVIAALPKMTNQLMRVIELAAVVIDMTSGGCSWLYDSNVVCWPAPSATQTALRRLARRLCRRLVGLALSGGSARSIAHVGVLDVLCQAGIGIDAISACGYAAVWAVLFAAGWSPDRIIKMVLGTVSHLRPFGRRFGLRDASLPGLFDVRSVRRWLQDLVGDLDLGDLQVPCCLAVSDVQTGKVIPVTEGSVFLPLTACVATPGLVTPVRQNGRLLHDALLLDPLPTDMLDRYETDVLLASTTLPFPGDQPAEVARCDLVNCWLETCSAVAHERSIDRMRAIDLVIVSSTGSFSDASFENAALLIECGRDAARQALPHLKALLEREE